MLYISEVYSHRAVYFTAELYSIVQANHILFIHLSVDEHLDYFSLMSTLNKETCVHIFDEQILCVHLVKYLEWNWLHHMKLQSCLPKWLHHLISVQKYIKIQFFHIFATI